MKQNQHVVLIAFLLSTSVLGRVLSNIKYPHLSVPLERRAQELSNPSDGMPVSTTWDHQPQPEGRAAAATCTSAKCQQIAKHFKDSFAPNYTAMNPCVEFDKYACDGWRNSHNYRPDQASLSVSSVLADTIRDVLHAILEGQYAENSTFTGTEKDVDKMNFGKMKTVYTTCINEDAIKAYGVAPVRDILAEFEKVYPVNGPVARNSSNDELTTTITWLAKRNVAGLLGGGSTVDDMNPNTTIIAMGASEIQMAKRYYNQSTVLANYTRAIAEMLQVLSSGNPIDQEPIPANKNASLFEKAQRIVSFEKLISQNVPDPEDAQDVKYYYQLRTLGEIEALVPQISVTKYFKSLVPPAYPIDSNRKVIVTDINFYKNLSSIIQSTPRQTLHDYFEWRLLDTWAGRLDSNYSAPVRRFNNLLVGREPDVLPDRWRTCVAEVDAGLGHILSGTFIQRMFTKKDKETGDQIIHDIKDVFRENLKTLDWMSESAKAIAATKVANLVQKVGYQTKNPNENSPVELEAYYAKLPISTNWFNNGLAFLEFASNKSWSDLLKPTDRDVWGMTAPTVNAYYNPPLNEIVFPAGIMQIPFFSGDLPEYVSYGGFGATAGHELTHGFDDNGSKYDAEGRLRDWWDNSTTVRFENKTDCFVRQYNEYSIEGLNNEKVSVNGKLTLGENIADAGGLNAAYRAWKKRDTASPNPALPGLESFTNDQLFFVSYANGWCEKIRKEALLKQVYSDPHSPADKRVVGPLDNSADFQKAFSCPNKKAKCDLW